MCGKYKSKIRKKIHEAQDRYQELKDKKRFSTGNKTAILCSSGDEIIGRWYRFSVLDIEKKSLIIEKATSQDLERVISDRNVSNIIVIGHADYSTWEASDRTVSWVDVSEMTRNHLKRGFFAKLGCNPVSEYLSVPIAHFYQYNIPLDHFCVMDRSRIYQAKDEFVYTNDLYKPEKFISLSKRKSLTNELKQFKGSRC